MARRERRSTSLTRRTATRRERRTIVVFTEGVGSEPDYVNALKRASGVREKTAIDLQVDPRHGVPMTLVEHAVERTRDDEVDECWCVFDVEWPQNHPGLREALALAERHGVRVAVSNPCFELWLILHFADHTAHVSTETAERMSRRLEGREGKRIDGERYMEHRATAAARAESLTRRHERDGTTFPDDNPSSSMGALLAAVERP